VALAAPGIAIAVPSGTSVRFALVKSCSDAAFVVACYDAAGVQAAGQVFWIALGPSA
jgi:hypothetical protein